MEKQRYTDFVQSQSGIPLFMQPWWLDVVCHNMSWDAIVAEDETKSVTGAWAFARHRLAGLPAIVLPPLTPFTGIWVKSDKELPSHKQALLRQEVLEELAKKLPTVAITELKIWWKIQDWIPFYWNGFRQETRYTFRFPDPDTEKIMENVSKSFRRNLRAAERKMITHTTDDIELLIGLIERVFEIRNDDLPFTDDIIRSAYKALKDRDQCCLYFADNEEGETVAGILAAWDEKTTYYLLGGRKGSNTQSANNLLLMRAISDAAERGHAFDFEGSMIRGVHKFFHTFGAQMQPYFLLYRYRGMGKYRYFR